MRRLECLILIVLLASTLIGGCQSHQKGIPRVILVGETGLHELPDPLSPEVATLTHGQQVMALPKKPSIMVGDWTEVRLDKNRSGYVKDSALAPPEIMETFKRLKQSIEEMEPQATGATISPTYFRLEPGRQGKIVEKLRTGTPFEMFERQVTFKESPTPDKPLTKARGKDVFYKVRLSDGRVGYIYTGNFKLKPPSEISQYTPSRRTLAWLILRTSAGKEAERANDYLVAYATPGIDFGADFDRIEGYIWDGKQYQTAFVKSALRGILPIRIFREGKNVSFEITELDPDHEKQVIVSRYPYAYPYKSISHTPFTKDIGLH